MHAALASNAGLLGSAERCPKVAQEPAIDPAQTHLYQRRDPMRAAEVRGPDCSTQSVCGIIREIDNLVFLIEGPHMTARAKNLFTHDR